MATDPDFRMPTLRDVWRQLFRPRIQASPPMSDPPRRLMSTAPAASSGDVNWAEIQRVVRTWPSGMAITSDHLAMTFGLNRGKAWRLLLRLEQAGLVYATTEVTSTGQVRKRRWVR
ncbi:MAG: hypothetical protein C7B45_16945 [Sulfobacillus acidophilus]|uniref:Uncharacterized protein n=1 Tax=Sulfobacillus acidophilus TaxID=53633 RepID=A0A2T2WCQ8_9FIRM|nr:MAG: hypothetical protein C7B45_16945 [Sulfobacillus acidophilus]